MAPPIQFTFRKYDVNHQVASLGLDQSHFGDEKAVRHLRRELFALAANPQYRRLVLDLHDADQLPSGACALLLALARRCEAAGGGLRLCGLQPEVDRLLDALEFEGVLGLYADRPAAVADTWS